MSEERCEMCQPVDSFCDCPQDFCHDPLKKPCKCDLCKCLRKGDWVFLVTKCNGAIVGKVKKCHCDLLVLEDAFPVPSVATFNLAEIKAEGAKSGSGDCKVCICLNEICFVVTED